MGNTLTLTPRQRIERAHVAIMGHPTFCLYGGVVLSGDIKFDVSPSIRTAATDGLNVVYNSQFIEGLTDKEINFVVLHENSHKAYKHLSTWKGLWKIDKRRANQACDYVINLQLKDADPNGNFLTVWEMALIDEKFRGMSAKQVFDLLPPQDQEGEGNGSGSMDVHDWEGAQSFTEKEVKEIAKQIEDALRQGAVAVGKKGGNLDRSTKDFLAPKIRWQDQLQDFLTAMSDGKDATTWAKTNRRFIAQGLYMPGQITETVGNLVIGGDTSGSIYEELKQFLGEISSIMETVTPERIDMLWWDTDVAGHEVYLPHEYPDFKTLTVPKGGGGTDPSCVPTFILKHDLKPKAVIMFTDGHVGSNWGNWNKVSAPVLWVVVGNKHATASSGKTIHIE